MTSQAKDALIVATARATPLTNAVAIRDHLHLEVSARTIRRRLHEEGLHHRTPAKKERLTDEHRARRLAFAQLHADKDMEFWGRAIFTDEKSFNSNCHGKLHCWRPDNTRFDFLCNYTTVIYRISQILVQ